MAFPVVAVPLPRRVIHVDWSMHHQKRWAAEATLRDGHFHAHACSRTTPSAMLAVLENRGTLVGFDFPIGVPSAYARRIGTDSFVRWLTELGAEDSHWSRFFDVATTAAEITPYRPFYPAAPGDKTQAHLVAGLGVASFDELYRRCDVCSGRKACALFWTLGGNQVGKGALTGWREVVQPALRSKHVRVWPFHGCLEDLISAETSVIVETYPGDVYSYVGATLPATAGGRGKRSQTSRAASAPGLLEWARASELSVDEALRRQIEDGFGDDKDGEDAFDATVGLFGMIAVVAGRRPVGIPADDIVARVEGWIFGRRSTDSSP